MPAWGVFRIHSAGLGAYVRDMRRHTIQDRPPAGHALAGGAVGALGLSVAVVLSAAWDQSPLGAPTIWPWVLTGLQVFSLWAAGRHHWWAWLLGGSVQVPWIAYALVTGQIGFVPGCVFSASVQIYSFFRNSTRTTRMEAMA